MSKTSSSGILALIELSGALIKLRPTPVNEKGSKSDQIRFSERSTASRTRPSSPQDAPTRCSEPPWDRRTGYANLLFNVNGSNSQSQSLCQWLQQSRSESQGQNLASTVLFAPDLLDCGPSGGVSWVSTPPRAARTRVGTGVSVVSPPFNVNGANDFLF